MFIKNILEANWSCSMPIYFLYSPTFIDNISWINDLEVGARGIVQWEISHFDSPAFNGPPNTAKYDISNSDEISTWALLGVTITQNEI